MKVFDIMRLSFLYKLNLICEFCKDTFQEHLSGKLYENHLILLVRNTNTKTHTLRL